MEKLIDLLNEYEKESNLKAEIFGEKSEFIIISKKFGFIKWLVDNEKIDFEKVYKSEQELNVDISVWKRPESNYYWLLMILAIQDEPIEFLVSILK